MSDPANTLDPSSFVINGRTPAKAKPADRRSRVVRDHPFIAGPIDLAWLAQARKLGVNALWLGLGLWHLKGLRKTDTFLLSNVLMEEWGLRPDAKSRALRKLEAAGLIRVERRGKRSPRVTILSLDKADAR